MNSLHHRNKHIPPNADPFNSGLVYRFTPHPKPRTKDGHISPITLKSSQSLPSLKSPTEDPRTTSHLSNKTTALLPSSFEPRPVQAVPPDHITIRVIDDPHGVTKNFLCPASLLLSSMTYFQENLSSYQDNWQDIDISVHCDLQVFSWLMDYILSDPSPSSSKPPPKLDAKRVFSVLVSSEYLGMPRLVDACIHFIAANVSAVLAVHSSADCLNQSAIDKLACLLSPGQIETMEDPNNLLQDKLYASKLRALVDPVNCEEAGPFTLDSVYKCADCHRIVIPGLEPMFLCANNSTQVRISPHGSLYYMHRRDAGWSARGDLEGLSKRVVSERDRFWRGWGYSHLLFCSVCKYVFVACDLDSCLHLSNGMMSSQSSNLMLLPSLPSSTPRAHFPGQEKESVAEFEEKLKLRIDEMSCKGAETAELSVWSRAVFDISVHQMLSQFKHLFSSISKSQNNHDTSQATSLAELQLFSHPSMPGSLSLNQFYRLKEDSLAPSDPHRQRPLHRVRSRDSSHYKSQKLRPFAGSVSGENEIGTGEDEERSEADSRSGLSAISKSRSLSSQHSLCSEEPRGHAPPWNPLRSRKNNIDQQRETEYVRSVRVSRCVQSLASLSLEKTQHPMNGSISDRIEKSFKASLTSKKLQRYQQSTDPKLRKKFANKQ